MSSYILDKHGYKRGLLKHSDLIHRQITFQQIYLPNRNKYPLPFSKYQVHHKDRNKTNNNPSNLKLVTEEKHQYYHAWEIKKKKASSGNLQSIRLLLGSKANKTITLLKLMVKVGFILGFLFLILNDFVNQKIIGYISLASLLIGVVGLLSIIILSIFGKSYDLIGTIYHEIKKLFE